MKRIILFVFLYFILQTSYFILVPPVSAQTAPYPQSTLIEGITWDFTNAVQLAPGSDLFPVTWGECSDGRAEGCLYTSWGDGGGFGGTNSNGRVSLGFARIEGSPDNLVETCGSGSKNMFNTWGGACTENSATFGGKAPGMISVDGTIYAWINTQNSSDADFRIVSSNDLGNTWTENTAWSFKRSEFAGGSFVQFGKDYANARDGYVYMYGRAGDDTPNLDLIRVPKNDVLDRSKYEFFSGVDTSSNPTWSFSYSARQATFVDPNGIGIAGVSYIPGIDRYILTMAHEADIQKLGVFEAPEPWGPWSTIEYNENWGNGLYDLYWLGYYIPTKTPDWLSSDGKTFHLVFTGDDDLDSFNVVKGVFTLAAPICGNGIIESGEACDDGDTLNGDGCSASCTVEPGWMCNREPSYCRNDVPYPPSDQVIDITFDQSTLVRNASGSDLFSTTWSGDDTIYTAYGDGSGFPGGETDSYLGVARITAELSELPSYTASDVWSTNGRSGDLGKCNGCIVAVDNTLYMYAQVQDQGWGKSTLLTSHDNGSTWLELDGTVYDRTISNWLFTETGVDFSSPGIIQFGKGHELNTQITDPDINGYVFGYSSQNCSDTSGTPGLCLFRVPQNELDTIASYEFFSGTSSSPSWSSNPLDKKPVFILPNLNWGYNAMYHPVFQRYWISARHDANTGGYGSGVWGLYDAPTPWGPWTTIAYDTDFPSWTYAQGDTSGNTGRPAFTHTFPAKWISPDGMNMWVTSDRGDQFNLYRSTVTLNGSPGPSITPTLTPTSGPTPTPDPNAFSVTIDNYTGVVGDMPSIHYPGDTDAFKTGARVVNDRSDTWTVVPPELTDKTRMLTARDDRALNAPTYDDVYTITINKPVDIYVTLDPRYSGTYPPWITTEGWTLTTMTASSNAQPNWTIHTKQLPQGTHTLGVDSTAYDGVTYVFIPQSTQPSQPGDTDGDDDVDISDLSTLLATFGSNGQGLTADFDGDDDVDISDLSTLLANFGASN